MVTLLHAREFSLSIRNYEYFLINKYADYNEQNTKSLLRNGGLFIHISSSDVLMTSLITLLKLTLLDPDYSTSVPYHDPVIICMLND